MKFLELEAAYLVFAILILIVTAFHSAKYLEHFTHEFPETSTKN